MCFSATASFVASGFLVSGGGLAFTKFKFSKRELALALIPVVFGLHQFAEGVVWLGVNGVVGQTVQNVAIYIFSFVALCFWPVFIPLAIFLYEYPKKKIPLGFCILVGFTLSAYLFWSFTIYSGIKINVQCCNSIAYIYYIPWGKWFLDGVYLFLVVTPFLLSSNPRIRYVLGPGFLATFLIALAMQSGYDYPSIWCFLAAILSVVNYYALLHPASRGRVSK